MANAPRYNNGNLEVWTGTGYQAIPTYNAADVVKSSQWKSASDDGFFSMGDNGYSAQDYIDRGYTQNEAGEWGKNVDTYGFNNNYGAYNNNLISPNTPWQNWQFGGDSLDNLTGKLKSADKVGTTFKYVLKDGKYVPQLTGQEYWNTNNTQQNMDMLKFLTTALTMGTAGSALSGLGGAIEAGTMPTLSQIGAGLNLVNSASGGSIPYLSTIGSLTGSVGNLSNLATNGINSLSAVAKGITSGLNVYNKGSQLSDMFTGGNTSAPTTLKPGGNIPTIGANRTMVTSTGGYPIDGGGNWPENGTDVNGGTNGYDTGATTNTGGGGTSTGDIDWGSVLQNIFNMVGGGVGNGNTGLADLYAAYNASKENRDTGMKLQQWYTDELGRRQPYLDRLNESYTNPDSFYNSNQWKGLESVYQNSIDREAAAKGRLANPTDREVLLQNYAMKSMEDYRRGLTGAAGVVNPNALANAAMRGAELESRGFNPYAAMIGRGGVSGPGTNGANAGSGLGNLIQQLYRAISGGGFSGGNYGGAPNGGYGGGVNSSGQPYGGNPEENYPYSDDYSYDYGYGGMTGGMGSANPDEYNPDDYSLVGDFGSNYDGYNYDNGYFTDDYSYFNDLPVDDTTWLDFFGGWFE